jgi:trimeric autotransporter adhesin
MFIFTKQTRKCQVVAGLMVVLALLPGIGCTGFFVNPTLASVAVGPVTPTIQQGNTLQMSASGTNNDGSATKPLTSTAFWSSSDPTIASVSSVGLVTGVAPGTATITASVGTVSGSTSVTVSLANITSILVTPSTHSTNVGTTVQYTATATTSNGSTTDITNSVTWASSNTNAGTIDSTGLFTALTTLSSSPQITIITATSGNISSPSQGPQAATLTVTQP